MVKVRVRTKGRSQTRSRRPKEAAGGIVDDPQGAGKSFEGVPRVGLVRVGPHVIGVDGQDVPHAGCERRSAPREANADVYRGGKRAGRGGKPEVNGGIACAWYAALVVTTLRTPQNTLYLGLGPREQPPGASAFHLNLVAAAAPPLETHSGGFSETCDSTLESVGTALTFPVLQLRRIPYSIEQRQRTLNTQNFFQTRGQTLSSLSSPTE